MSLLYHIERHLRRSGVTATAFGREAMNDPGFVRYLRNGRQPTPKTEARILAFIAASQQKCATVEEVRACAG